MRISEGAGKAPAQGRRGMFLNALGILLAFGAAFGGMFLVRECLLREMAALLGGSGTVAVPAQPAVEAAPLQEAGLGETEREKLTEEELFLAVEGFRGTEELYPHEPRQGQMTMAQALEEGRGWLEEFFLPRLGMEDVILQEYRVSCYLWTRQAEDGDPLLSYWSLSLSGQALGADLVLDAVSGQVLSASVIVYSPVEYQDQVSLMALLEDYTDFLGVESDPPLVDARGRGIYRSIGENGMYAALKTGSLIISVTDGDLGGIQEVFHIQLYLDNWSRWSEGRGADNDKLRMVQSDGRRKTVAAVGYGILGCLFGG